MQKIIVSFIILCKIEDGKKSNDKVTNFDILKKMGLLNDLKPVSILFNHRNLKNILNLINKI
jgi:hypothetical protein